MSCVAEHGCHIKRAYYDVSKKYAGELCGGCLWWHGPRLTLDMVLNDISLEDLDPDREKKRYPDLLPYTEPITGYDKFYIQTTLRDSSCSNCGQSAWLRDPGNDKPGEMAFVCICGNTAIVPFRAERTDLRGFQP